MKTQFLRSVRHFGRSALLVMAAGLILTASPSLCQAGFIVGRGYDLLQTWPGNTLPGGPVQTTFLGQQFQGVSPYGFNFGGRVGFKRMGDSQTSMIVERLGRVQGSPGGTKTVKVKLRYFKLRSTNQINLLGNGKAYYYVTLQKAKASTGTYSIHFNSDGSGGTIDASITLRYAVRKGPRGRVVMRGTTTLSMHEAWTREYDWVNGRLKYGNYLLNGRNTSEDFLLQAGHLYDPNITWTSSDGNFNILTRPASPFNL
jgi:hypothetical protein